MAKKSYAVIGLGQFGTAVVEELVDKGVDVIAIDTNEESVKKVSQILPTCFIADSTNEEALKELGIKDVDAAIIAFGQNDKAMILTTVILKELGVKRIIVRVDNDYYIPIMTKLGATEVVSPQKSAGAGLANRLESSDYKDYFKLDRKYNVVSIMVNPSFIPITISELSPNQVYGVNILLIVRKDGNSFVPSGQDKIFPDDKVFVVGTNREIKAFREGINGKRGRLKKAKKPSKE